MPLPRAMQIVSAGLWPRDKAFASVTLDFDGRYRRRIRLTLDGGKGGILLDLPHAARLQDGDGLLLEDGRYVLVCAAMEEVMDITATSQHDAIRIAWHLGNRHLPVQVLEDGVLRLRYDHVIEHMVEGLGGRVRRTHQIFSPEPGAYEEGGGYAHAHPHAHSHDD